MYSQVGRSTMANQVRIPSKMPSRLTWSRHSICGPDTCRAILDSAHRRAQDCQDWTGEASLCYRVGSTAINNGQRKLSRNGRMLQDPICNTLDTAVDSPDSLHDIRTYLLD